MSAVRRKRRISYVCGRILYPGRSKEQIVGFRTAPVMAQACDAIGAQDVALWGTGLGVETWAGIWRCLAAFPQTDSQAQIHDDGRA